jgi:GNAT superfamily N-acetyltransferase
LTAALGDPTLSLVSSWAIEQWPRREQSDELLAELHTASAPLDAEATPDDPRRPLADEIAAVRHLPAIEDGMVVVARDPARAIVGFARCTWEQLAGWDHLVFAELAVVPSSRGQGLGRLLLERTADIAQQQGKRLVMGRTRENIPSGARFCEWFGAEAAYANWENRLDMQSVDTALVDHWIADGPARAPGYRLQFVAGRTPAELTGHVAEVNNVMNTAPREGMDVGDFLVTADLIREYEESAAAAGRQQLAYYAVDESSGRFVGATSIQIEPGSPDRVWVGDTAVAPAHRGRGLGKWLKAAITRQILADLPEVRWVITWNAGSNEAMLGINSQLGFRLAAIYTTWQIATDRLKSRLAARAAGT